MRSFRSRQLFLLSIFTLFTFFSPISNKFLDLRRRLQEANPIDIQVDYTQFSRYDLEFSANISKNQNFSLGDSFTLLLMPYDEDEFRYQQIPLNAEIRQDESYYYIHALKKIQKRYQYWTGNVTYVLSIVAGYQETWYKGSSLNITMVDDIVLNVSMNPFMKVDNRNIYYTYVSNTYEVDIINSVEQKAVYAKVIKIMTDSKYQGINVYKPMVELDPNGHLSVSENYKDSTLVVIAYNEKREIIYISHEMITVNKENLNCEFRRNIYIKYNQDPHLFLIVLNSIIGSDSTTAIQDAKFVYQDGSMEFELTRDENEENNYDNSQVFDKNRTLDDLQTGKYYVFVTMAGMKNVNLTSYITVYDNLYSLYFKENSGLHTCNYYKSNQQYNLIPQVDLKFTPETHLLYYQKNPLINRAFTELGQKYYLKNNKNIAVGEGIIKFYESSTLNYPDMHNYYQLKINLTDMEFDCENDECGYCTDVDSAKQRGHEVFGEKLIKENNTGELITASFRLKNLTCDASELTYTFVNKKKGHTIYPTCTYLKDSQKLNCTWEESQCYGGNYKIYADGIEVDFFNYYCPKYSCAKPVYPETIQINEENNIEIEFEDTTIVSKIQHLRLKNQEDECSKIYSPSTGQNTSNAFTISNITSSISFTIVLSSKRASNAISKYILENNEYLNTYSCGCAYPQQINISKLFEIPCENLIVLKNEQLITLKWEDSEIFNKTRNYIFYKTRYPSNENEYSEDKQLVCKDIDDNNETECTINTENIDDPRYLLIGIDNTESVPSGCKNKNTEKIYKSTHRMNLITYTTDLDTCQELIPNQTLTDVVVELNYPNTSITLDITPSFKVNNSQIQNITKDIDYTVKSNKFTFTLDKMSPQKLVAGEYNVIFNHTCANKNIEYMFSQNKKNIKSKDADFTLSAYMKFEEVLEGNKLYTSEQNNQTLRLRLSTDIPEVTTLIFKNGNYNYTLDASFGRDSGGKIIEYDVNLYEKRDELIRGTYKIYYKSRCPNDPDIDTGLTIFLEYNELTLVDKNCLYSGDVNIKVYTLTYQYEFEKEWRRPQTVYGILGTEVIYATISSYNGKTLTAIINTNLKSAGDYYWAFKFNDNEQILSNKTIYAYMNKIEAKQRKYNQILHTKNLTSYNILLNNEIRNGQLVNVTFNYEGENMTTISNYSVSQNQRFNLPNVKLFYNFVFLNQIGEAVIGLEGKCAGEDGDYSNYTINVIKECEFPDCEFVFVANEIAYKGDNEIDIIAEEYEIRKITKIRFKEIDKCAYPKSTEKYVYFCTQSLFDEGDSDCTEKNNLINFAKFKKDIDYVRIYVNFKAEFQYEYILETMWNKDGEQRIFYNSNINATFVIRNRTYFLNYTNYIPVEQIILKDYDDSESVNIFQLTNGMNNVSYTTNFINNDAAKRAQIEISCSIDIDQNNCSSVCEIKDDTYLDCLFTFKSISTYTDISVYYKDGTCEKKIYIIEPVLDECSLVTDAKDLTMPIYSKSDIGDFNIYIASKELTDKSEIGIYSSPDEVQFDSNDKISISPYKKNAKAVNVYFGNDLFSNDKTTYYYFYFIKGETNKFIIKNAIVKKLGTIITDYSSHDNKKIYTQIYNDNLYFTFKHIFDNEEIDNFEIVRENNKKCDHYFDSHTYTLNNRTHEDMKLLTQLKLIEQYEYGNFTPYYTTKHCSKQFKGTPVVTILPPSISLTMVKKDSENKTCVDGECCKYKLYHHVGVEHSTFTFTSNYYINSYDLPDKIRLKNGENEYTYDITEKTSRTNTFSFIIPSNEKITPGYYTVSVVFNCTSKEITMDEKIFIYENDVIFAKSDDKNNFTYFYEDYEKHFKPNTFPFEYEIISEQIKSVTEQVFTCTPNPTCYDNGCPAEQSCTEKETTPLMNGRDYEIKANKLIIKKYNNERFTNEKRIITIVDLFCQTTKIGIKSKPNTPDKYIITYEPNVCGEKETTISLKFPCQNYDINQIKEIFIYNSTENSNVEIGKSEITYDTTNFEIKFTVYVTNHIKLISFIDESDTTQEILLNKIYNIDSSTKCYAPANKEYVISTYNYTSQYDYFIYKQDMDKPKVEIAFYSEEHANQALSMVKTRDDTQLECLQKTSDKKTLECIYNKNITGALRVKFYVDNRCEYYFDVIKVTYPPTGNNCQYYSGTLKDYVFVIDFDSSLEYYEKPNQDFQIIANRYYERENTSEPLTVDQPNNVTYTYSYLFKDHPIESYANYTFTIQKIFTKNGIHVTGNYALEGKYHAIGYVIPYAMADKFLSNKENNFPIGAKNRYKINVESIDKMNIYENFETKKLYSYSDKCATGNSVGGPDEFNCNFDLRGINETGKYYITVTDLCANESALNDEIYIYVIHTPNFLKKTSEDKIFTNQETETTLTFKNGFYGNELIPKKIELIRTSDNKTSEDLNITINFNDPVQLASTLTTYIKSNDEQGLFKFKIQYQDDTIEYSKVYVYIGADILKFEKINSTDLENNSTTYNLSDTISSLNINFRTENWKIEQIKEIRWKYTTNKNDDTYNSLLPKLDNYTQTESGIIIYFNEPLIIDGSRIIIIDDYLYDTDKKYYIYYNLPNNFTLLYDIFFIQDGAGTIELPIYIEMDSENVAKDNVDQFYIQNCCDGKDWQNLNCTIYTENNSTLYCKYTENATLTSPTSYIIRYKKADNDITKRKIFVTPSVISAQDYSKEIDDQVAVYSHSPVSLQFYLNDNEIKISTSALCAHYYSYMLFFKEIQKGCNVEGKYQLTVYSRDNSTATKKTVIREFTCIASTDIKNIPTTLYSGKSDLQNFQVILNKTVESKYITSITFERVSNVKQKFETTECYYGTESSDTFTCTINLKDAAQGNYNVYYSTGMTQYVQSSLFNVKFFKNYRDIDSVSPKMIYAYQDSDANITFNTHFNYTLVSYLELIDKNNNAMSTKIMLNENLLNPVIYPITIPKGKFSTGYYSFKVNFIDKDDTFENNKETIYILEKQEFVPLPKVVVQDGENITLRIKHVNPTVHIEKIKLCNITFEYEDGIYIYKGKFDKCGDLVPTFSIEGFSDLKMDFEFIIENFTNLYKISALDSCLYYKLDQYAVTLTSISESKIDLSSLTVQLTDKTNKFIFTDSTNSQDEEYKQYQLTLTDDNKIKLLTGEWNIEILGNTEFNSKLYSQKVEFTDLSLPVYVMKEDTTIEFTNAKCKLATPFVFTFKQGDISKSVTCSSAEFANKVRTMTLGSKLPKFTSYGEHDLYLTGSSISLGKLFVSNTLADSTFTIEANINELTQNTIKVKSDDYYCKLIKEFNIKKLGYKKYSEYITINQEFTNNKTVTVENDLSNPATEDLAFIVDDSSMTYKHDTYNYQFEITKIVDNKSKARTFYNSELYYEGPTYVENIKLLSSVFFINANTNADDKVFIPLELINSGEWNYIRIDNEITRCIDLTNDDYTNFNIKKNNDKKYVKCEYTYEKVKQLEITYKNNPCVINNLILATYLIEGPTCLTLGQEQLSNEPTIMTIVTPRIETMMDITTKIGQYNADKKEIFTDNDLVYTLVFTYNAIQESSNYNYQILLNNENKEAITLALDSEEAPKMYKYVDMESVDGTLPATPSDKVPFKVNLYSPIRNMDLPIYFILVSVDSKDTIISTSMKLDTTTYKTIEIQFDLKNAKSDEYILYYINQCDKRVKFSKHIARGETNSLYSVKYNTAETTLTLTYSKVIKYVKPEKITLGEVNGTNAYTFNVTHTDNKDATVKIDELRGLYNITTVYNGYQVLERQEIYLNGKTNIKLVLDGVEEQVKDDYNVNWYELQLTDEAFDGLLTVGYQKYTGDNEEPDIKDIGELTYTIEPSNKTLIRFDTSNIIFSIGYNYLFYVTDTSSNTNSYYYIKVTDPRYKFTFDKHFYNYEDVKDNGINFNATGEPYVYYKPANKEYYYNKVSSKDDNRETFIYIPSNKEEIVSLYYSTTDNEVSTDKTKIGVKLYIYSDINNLISFDTDTCIYLPNKEFNLNLQINSNVQKTFLKFKMDDTEIKESNSVYTISKNEATFKILDGQVEIHSLNYTFTDLQFTQESAEINAGIVSFNVSAKCAPQGITIKVGTEEYQMTCAGQNNEYKCTSETITGKVNSISVYSKGVQIKELKVYTTYDQATLTLKKASIIYPNIETTVKLSSNNYNMSQIKSIVFQHKNTTTVPFSIFTVENNEISLGVTVYSKTDELKLIDIKDKSDNELPNIPTTVIATSDFEIYADQFFLAETNKELTVQFIGQTSETYKISNATTTNSDNKVLIFGGNTCQFNKDCKLKVENKGDYSEFVGLSTLKISYNDVTKEVNTKVIVRNKVPQVVSGVVNENPKIFAVEFDQNIYDEDINYDKLYFKIITQSSELKCTSKIQESPSKTVDVTCPVSYVEGFKLYAYVFDNEQKITIDIVTCTGVQILDNNVCKTCKEKNPSKALYYDGKCYSSCPKNTYSYDNVCYATCPNSYPIQDTKCVEKCSDGYGLSSSLQNKCQNCKEQGLLLADGYCVKECPKGLTYIEERKACVYVLRITTKITEEQKGKCKNGTIDESYENIVKCKCNNGWYGSTCSYSKDDAKIENNKLYMSIFAYGKIGKNGQIQTVVPIDYNSEELLGNLADLIDGLRNETFDPNEDFLDRILNQTNNTVNELLAKFNLGTLSDLEKENMIAILTFSIEIVLTEAKRRRLSNGETNQLNQFINIMKKFVLNTNTLKEGQLSNIEPNSFGLFNVKTYKNKKESKTNLTNSITAENNTGKLAYITLKDCQNTTIPADAQYHLLEATNNSVANLKGLDALTIDGVDDALLKTCKPTYAYKTGCEDPNAKIGDDSTNAGANYIKIDNQGKGVDFSDANQAFFNDICYVVPDDFLYDLTYKTRAVDLYPSSLNLNFKGKETCNRTSSEVQCGDALEIECDSDAEPDEKISISSSSTTSDKKTDYNLVTKCAKDANELGKNTAFVLYLIFVLLLFISGIIYIAIDLLGKCEVTDSKKFAEDENTYLNPIPYMRDGQNEDVQIKGNNDTTANPNENSFGDLFRNNFLKLHPLTSHFFLSLINPIWLKLAFFFCEILILFGFNAILFKDDYIDTRMSESNRNSFGYPMSKEFPRIILSILCCICITFIARAICFVTEGSIKLLKESSDDKDKFAQFSRNILPRRIATVLILLAMVAVSWYYSTAFCYIYHKTQKGWIQGGIWSVLFNWIIFAPIYILIISAVERNHQFAANVMKKLFIF